MNFKHKFVFLLPGLIVLIGILIFPIIFTVRLSLSGWNSFNPELDFVGIKNYINFLLSKQFNKENPNILKALTYFQ